MSLAGASIALARKDLRIEARSPAGAAATMTFGVSALLVVSLAAGPDLARLRDLAPALTTIAGLFASILMAERLDRIDRETEALAGLWLCLTERRALFLGKVLALTVLLSILVIGLWLVAWVLLDLEPLTNLAVILPLAVLSSAACASAGALVVAIANAGPRSGLTLPVLLLPLLVPTLLATVQAGGAFLAGDWSGGAPWLVVIGSEIALFMGIGLLAYELVAAPE
ncbi:MAG: heme exporter protein CcmB [Candidatus Limnocylindrales bacterium]